MIAPTDDEMLIEQQGQGINNAMCGSLIDGLPNSVTVQCLVRVPLYCYPTLQGVSRAWRSIIQSPDLFRARKFAGKAEDWLYATAYEPDKFWEAYDPRSDNWIPIPALPSGIPRLANFGTASVDGKLYVIGGGSDDVDPRTGDRDLTFSTDEVWRFDPITRKWEQRSSLLTPRAQFACCVLDQKIVVAGGFTKPRKSVCMTEVYDPEENSWSSVADMTLVHNAACAGVSMDGKMFVFHKGITHGQVYDLHQNRWMVSELGWSSGQMAIVNGELYIVSCGMVNKELKQPTFRKVICSLPGCLNRIGVGAIGLGDDLYVIGGIKDPQRLGVVPLNHLDICSVGSEVPIWRKGASLKVCKGSILGCAVVTM